MLDFLSGLSRTLLPYEVGAIAAFGFVLIVHYCFSRDSRAARRAHKARVKLAVERARAFLAETTAARGGFVDNGQVEAWWKEYEEDLTVIRNEGAKVPITAETPRCTCGGFLVPCHNHANGQDFMGCTSYHDLQPYKHVSYPLSLPALGKQQL